MLCDYMPSRTNVLAAASVFRNVEYVVCVCDVL